MVYSKPEITLLGDARLIQGSKIDGADAGSLDAQLNVAHCELDD
jgi:hypothetical protein